MSRLLRLPFLSVLLPLLLTGQAAFAQPTANFSASPTSGCAPLTVYFTDNSSGTITSYSWNLGNAVTSAFPNPSTTYYTPGTYPISLTVTGPGGTDTKTIPSYITVYDKPAVSFTATPTAVCLSPGYVQFSSSVTPNAPGALTYEWGFGDGTSGSGANPDHTYASAGTYDVSLTVTNGAGCSRTFVRNAYITIHPMPVPSMSASQLDFCGVPATVTFTNTSSGGTPPYPTTSWTFGDGGTGTGSPVPHTYTTGGSFTVSMTVTDSKGCSRTIYNSNYISVNTTPPTFTAPAAACAGEDVTFTNTTNPSAGTYWDFGDGTTTTGPIAIHAYDEAISVPTVFTVTMIAVIGDCNKTLTKTITIHPKPVATITMNPLIPCPPPVTVSFSGNSTYATGYAWSWSRGGTASGQTVSKTYPKPPPFTMDTLTLITTSAAGCTSKVVMDDIMIRDILVEIGPGPGNETYKGCRNTDFTFTLELQSHLPPPPPPMPPPYLPYPLPAISWAWDFGDPGSAGNTSNLQAPSHRYLNTGDYIVTCTITTPNGCTATGIKNVHVDIPVKPDFTGSPLIVCPKTPVTFINNAPHLPGTVYTWLFFEEHIPIDDTTLTVNNNNNVQNKFKLPGTYTVKVFSNHGGCIDSLSKHDYVVVNPPGAKFSSYIHCPPNQTTVDFTNLSSNATSQLWDFGDGTTSTLSNPPPHVYATTGTYNVKLKVHNSTFNCDDETTIQIILFKPVVDFNVDDQIICRNEFARFHAAFTGSGAVTYSWIFDNYQTLFSDADTVVDFQYLTRGLHTVTLIANSGSNCNDTVKKTDYILVSQPDVHFSANTPIGCQPLPLIFTDNSTNTAGVGTIGRIWKLGNNDTIANNLPAVSYTYPSKGNYHVELIVEDIYGCKDSLTRNDYISVRKPVADFTMSVADTACAYQQVQFSSTATGTGPLRQQWGFGDGATDTGTHPTHKYTAPGLYPIRLIVTDTLGCADTNQNIRSIFVSAPHAAFTLSDSVAICPPLQVRFNNTSTGALTYRWDFGVPGGSPVFVTNPVNTYSAAGLYNAMLVAIDSLGCTDTAQRTVRVLGYDGAFTYTPTEGCAPMVVQFSSPVGASIPQITWDFSDGATAITTGGATTISHTYDSGGTYLPRVIFSDGSGGCTSVSIGLQEIKADKVKAAFSWSVPCAGTAFTLTDKSTALFLDPSSSAWRFGDTGIVTGSPVSYTFATPGLHPVTLVASNATGCTDSLTLPVWINPLPPVDATADTFVCPGDRVVLEVRGADQYTWSPAPDSMANCPVCDIAYVHLDTPALYRVYTVTGTDGNGCVNKDSTRVTIQIKTTSTVKDGGEICVGESFRLEASGAQHYAWQPSATIDSPFIASPLARPESTTTYIVAAQEGSCLIDSGRVTVVVHSLPQFSAGTDQIINLGSAVTLHATRAGITRIEWSQDTTLSCWDCYDPNGHPYYTRTYYARGYNEYGCWSEDSVTVHVRCNGSLVYIPNTFTPNGDGVNEYFYPRGQGIDRMSAFRVYDRWGEVVFDRSNVLVNDERGGWDGTYKGKALAPDVYIYVMQSRCETGEPVQWKGDITLMR